MERLMSQYSNNDKFLWNRDNDNFEVLKQSDILISDFSGVIFDYTLVFDKPIIYTDTKIDMSPFDASWLEETPWTLRILPELGFKLTEDNINNMKDIIDKCIDDPSFAAGRDKARAETWVHMGEGAKRSVDFIMEKYNEVIARKEMEEKKDIAASKNKKKISLKGS